jgi:hypothetical protein
VFIPGRMARFLVAREFERLVDESPHLLMTDVGSQSEFIFLYPSREHQLPWNEQYDGVDLRGFVGAIANGAPQWTGVRFERAGAQPRRDVVLDLRAQLPRANDGARNGVDLIDVAITGVVITALKASPYASRPAACGYALLARDPSGAGVRMFTTSPTPLPTMATTTTPTTVTMM